MGRQLLLVGIDMGNVISQMQSPAQSTYRHLRELITLHYSGTMVRLSFLVQIISASAAYQLCTAARHGINGS
jgi:hypothetical protein